MTRKECSTKGTTMVELNYVLTLLSSNFGFLLSLRSNQSILKEINPECSLAGLMLKLKLQYFGHLMQRASQFIGKDPDDAAAAAAATAAKSLQSCPTLCDPIDRSPPGSPVPGILQARTLEWVAISFSSA